MTTSDTGRKIQLEPTVDATAVVPGVEATKAKIGEIGQAGQRAGEQGSAGLAKIGEGGQQASTKVDAATRSIAASIQRTTAVAQAGERGTAAYFQKLAEVRGINADALKPYLDQLRAAEQAQRAAAGSLGRMEVSAAQTAAALRQVPAQFTDIVTSLQAGQAPLQVLLQQGGQLKDAFGGAGAAARALGGYVAGLVNPFTVTVAAVAGLAVAFEKGSGEGRAFERTLLLTGNAAGTTAERLNAAAESLARTGITQSAAADALNQLAATGRVGADNLGRFAAAAINLERVGGPAVEETVKAFAELGKAPLQAALKLNESTNFLTASLYQQIKALESQGRATEAARVAQEAFAGAQEQRMPALAANLGILEKAWLGVKDAIKGAGDELLKVGRRDTVADLETQLKVAQSRADRLNGGGLLENFFRDLALKETNDLKQQIESRKEIDRLAAKTAGADAARRAQIEAISEFDKIAAQSLDKQAKLKLEIARIEQLGATAGKSRAEIEQQIAAARERYKDDSGTELAGMRAKVVQLDAYLAKLKEIRATGRFDLLDGAKQTDGERRVIELQEQLRGAIGGVTKAKLEQELVQARQQASREREIATIEDQVKGQKRAYDEYQKLIDATGKSADSIEQQAQRQEAANQVFGQGKAAIEEVTLAELKRQAAELEATNSVDPAYLANLYAKIAAQERFVKALNDGDYKSLNAGLDEWLRSATEQDRLYREEQRLTGLSRLERDKIIAARQVELKLAKELAAIDRSTATDDEKEAARIKARTAAQIESSAAVNKVMRDDAGRTADYIEQSLTDALMRGFEDGKGAAQNFRDTLVNMFKSLVLRPILQPVMSNIAGGIGQILGLPGQAGASATGGGPLSMLSSLGSAGNAASLLGLGGLGSAFSGGAALTLSGAGGTGLALQGSGSLLANGALGQGLAQGAGALAPWALGAAAGIYGGRAISGGYSAIGGGSGNTAVNVGTAIGAIWGPLGAAIGGAIGGVVNRAFGMKAKEVGAQGIEGQASMLGFSGYSFAEWLQKGGWFRSDKRGTDYGTVSTEQDQVLDQGIHLLYTATAEYAKVLGLPVDSVKSFATQFKVAWGKTDEENAAAIQTAMTNLGEQLAGRYADYLKPLQKAGETLSTTLQRLSGLQLFSDSLSSLGGIFSRIAGASFDAREQLIGLAGGMDALTQQAQGFAQNYYNRDEIAAIKAREISTALGGAGLSTNLSSRDDFRALVEGMDPNTEAGRKQLATALGLQGSFASVADYLSETGRSLSDVAAGAPTVTGALGPLLDSASAQLGAQRDAIDAQLATRDATLSVKDAVDRLADAIASSAGSAAGFVRGYRQPEVGLAA